MFSPNTKILVCDDAEASVRNVVDCLRQLGFSRITTAADGSEGFQKLHTALKSNLPIELIISDWNMPNLNGLELLQKIRASVQFKTVPFILLTSMNEGKDVMSAVSAGVSTYIVKPVDLQTLKAKLERIWGAAGV